MTLYARRPTWLYDALDLNEPQIPVDLDTQTTQSTIDVFQNGQALVRNVEIVRDFPQNTAEADEAILPASVNRVRIIHYIDCFNSAGTTWFFNCFLARPGGITVRITEFDIPANATVGTVTLLQGVGRLWIPPGFEFRVFFTATGAGEVRRFDLYAQDIPFGFNPSY